MLLEDFVIKLYQMLSLEREAYMAKISIGIKPGTRVAAENWIKISKDIGLKTYDSLLNKKSSENLSNKEFYKILRNLEIECNNNIADITSKMTDINTLYQQLWNEKAKLLAYQTLMDEYPKEG